MKGKKYVLMLTLTFLLGTIIASVPPVKPESYETRLHVRESPPGSYIPGVTPPGWVWVTFDIETPSAWSNTADGIVGWVFSVRYDPSVLDYYSAHGRTFDYFLYDWCDWYGWTNYTLGPPPIVDEVNGTIEQFGEMMVGAPPIGLVGAGGSSYAGSPFGGANGLAQLRFRSISETAYSRIEIYDAFWVDINETKHAFDVLYDGHYNDPGFTYLHSQSSLIDLSSPVGTSWHELYPEYCTTSSLNDWVDTGGDGILSHCDFIQLNDTWYHVEEVTVTIETTTAYGEEMTSTNSPSSTSVVAAGWATPENAYSSNDLYTSTATKTAVQEYGNYGFSLPSGATITKVEVGYEAYTADNDMIGITCSWDGGTSWATKYVSPALPTVDPDTVTWVDFTGDTSWTIDKLSDANFKVHASYEYTGGAKDTYLDWLPARVTYISPLPLYLEYIAGFDYMYDALANPNGTYWHEVYPVFCAKYEITNWTDSDDSGNITFCDYIQLKNATGDTTTYHVEDVHTDIIISGPIPEPPEFPLGLALEISLIAAIAYVWWRSRRKTKITKQTKLAY